MQDNNSLQNQAEEEKQPEQNDSVTSRAAIEGTDYQMIWTTRQVFGMIRAIGDDLTKKFDFSQHKAQYDRLVNHMLKSVQQTMVETHNLQEVWIPEDRHVQEIYHDKPKANIFMSQEFKQPRPEENRGRRALVLIQGTGAVRAGIWTRSVCINENLELGSMLPFMKVCDDLNIPVLVMNPNLSRDPESGEPIPCSRNMQEHAVYVWDKYVKDSGFDQISIVAHSAGGGCVSAIQSTFVDTFYQQVKSIAYTDSWVTPRQSLNQMQQNWMFQNAVHYKASQLPVGTVISSDANTQSCPIVSAGHPKHEFTTGTSQKHILNQFGYRQQV